MLLPKQDINMNCINQSFFEVPNQEGAWKVVSRVCELILKLNALIIHLNRLSEVLCASAFPWHSTSPFLPVDSNIASPGMNS